MFVLLYEVPIHNVFTVFSCINWSCVCAKQTCFECCYFYMFIVEVLFTQSEHLLGIVFTKLFTLLINMPWCQWDTRILGKNHFYANVPKAMHGDVDLFCILPYYEQLDNNMYASKCCKLEIKVKFIYNLYQPISVPLSYQAITLASSMSYLKILLCIQQVHSSVTIWWGQSCTYILVYSRFT